MPKRKLYPPAGIDRVMLWSALVFNLVGQCFWLLPEIREAQIGRGDAIKLIITVIGVSSLLIWAFVYLIQDRRKDEFEDYSDSIAKIEGISKQLSELSNFLKQERQRVEESEATLTRLREEQTKLEPVVLAQRDTVTAILDAHARTTASRAWKERALGFMSGLFASLIATMVFEYLRR